MKKVRFYVLLLVTFLLLCAVPEVSQAAASQAGPAKRTTAKQSNSGTDVSAKSKAAVPTTPKLKTIANTSSGVKLTWSKAKRADGYLVMRANPDDSYFKVIRTIRSGSTLKYTDKRAVAGKDYYYTVRAYRMVKGVKIRSGYNSYGTLIRRMKQPELTVRDMPGEVQLSWKKVKGASGYYIYRREASRSSYSWVQTIGSGSVVSYSDIMVNEKTKYYYKITAFPSPAAKTRVTSKAKSVTHKKAQSTAVDGQTDTVYRAFLVGETKYNSKYFNPSNPGRDTDSGNLYGPHYDIQAMYNMLKRMNYSYVGAWENLTRQQILSRIPVAFAAADEDDVSLFFYSGHGNSDKYDYVNSGALDLPGGESISLQELANVLNQIPGKVIIILDSCGSGAGVQAPDPYSLEDGGSAVAVRYFSTGDFSPKAFNRQAISTFSRTDNGVRTKFMELANPNKFYVITAASVFQESFDIPESIGTSGGALTRGLVQGCGYSYKTFKMSGKLPADLNADSGISLEEGWKYAQKIVTSLAEEKQDVQRYPAGSDFLLWKK